MCVCVCVCVCRVSRRHVAKYSLYIFPYYVVASKLRRHTTVDSRHSIFSSVQCGHFLSFLPIY